MVQVMITFKQFIAEAEQFDLEKFKKDCAFMLHQLEGTGGRAIMYRGDPNAPTDASNGWRLEDWVERTSPRDTAQKVHDTANSIFSDMFGVKARNWMFATGDFNDAANYSSPSKVLAVFPVGKFQWLCSPNIHDFTSWIMLRRQHLSKLHPELSYDERTDMVVDNLQTEFDKVVWNFNERLKECLESKAEIMFKCDRYYAFNVLGDVFTKQVKPFLETL